MLLVPLTCQKRLSFFAIARELDAVPPAGVERIGQSDFRRVSSVPAVFGQPNLFDGAFAGEGGEWGT
ncbi:hypothetical protein D3C87_2080150 [compost metagenome]